MIDFQLQLVQLQSTPRLERAGFRLVNRGRDGECWQGPNNGMRIIWSVEQHGGSNWIHMSCSRLDRIPDWNDLHQMRDLIVGDAVEAYAVCPPASRYVNIHPNVLHLYSSTIHPDGVLPDFSAVINGVRTI